MTTITLKELRVFIKDLPDNLPIPCITEDDAYGAPSVEICWGNMKQGYWLTVAVYIGKGYDPGRIFWKLGKTQDNEGSCMYSPERLKELLTKLYSEEAA